MGLAGSLADKDALGVIRLAAMGRCDPAPDRVDSEGRAYKGSMLQLQAYVNRHAEDLDSEIRASIAGVAAWPGIRWVFNICRGCSHSTPRTTPAKPTWTVGIPPGPGGQLHYIFHEIASDCNGSQTCPAIVKDAY